MVWSIFNLSLYTHQEKQKSGICIELRPFQVYHYLQNRIQEQPLTKKEKNKKIENKQSSES